MLNNDLRIMVNWDVFLPFLCKWLCIQFLVRYCSCYHKDFLVMNRLAKVMSVFLCRISPCLYLLDRCRDLFGGWWKKIMRNFALHIWFHMQCIPYCMCLMHSCNVICFDWNNMFLFDKAVISAITARFVKRCS